MQLLVSVADEREAEVAVGAGADLVDAKDPRRGPLGAVTLERLRAIHQAVRARRPTSAALGDASSVHGVLRRARAARAAGARYVKLGFRGTSAPARVREFAGAARAGAGTGLVLVAYADWERAEGPPPGVVLDAAVAAGAEGVLLDTAVKDRGLFAVRSPGTVGGWIAMAHDAGLVVAIAGSLGEPDLETACALGADWVGVRGAACNGGRTGSISAARIAALSALARAPARRAAGTGV
jgi:dihydroneopterin aldolase